MKFYLSSYKLGNEMHKIKELAPKGNTKTAYIANAMDFSTDLERRKKSEALDIAGLKQAGLDVETLDLRSYFDRGEELEQKLAAFGVIWVRGGNTFVLRKAMEKSGFDQALRKLSATDMLYGGYSAGVCVLGPTLKGIHLMDDPTQKPYGEDAEVLWDGLGMIEYTIVPHFQSDHPETEDASKAAAYLAKHNMPFKTLRDGEVIIQT